jgi:branched-chain amino acid transport system ATP-binding protein
MLAVEHLQKCFDGFTAVDNLSLKLQEGESHAVIGPNGAGKTTFFNLVTGHLKPDAGQILFKGQPITSKPPHRIARMGLARSFQLLNIFPRLSLSANLQVALTARAAQHYNLFKRGDQLHRQEAAELLIQVGLAQLSTTPAGALAYGQQKQLELAIALATAPDLLLLDEPTAGMAAAETTAAIRLISRLKKEHGLTLLFTEHDMQVVFDMADRISVLHQGRIIASGTPAEIRVHEEVRRIYLGSEK